MAAFIPTTLLLEETIESVRTDGRGEVVHRKVWPDGTVRWLEGRALLLRDCGGRPVGMTGVAHDVTESREAEERLRAAEAKYRSLVEDLPLATYVDALDTTSSNIYTSPQIEKLLGYSREEWLANPDLFPKTLHPDDRERVLAEHARTYETGEPLRSEYRVTAKDGRVVWIQDEAVIVRTPAAIRCSCRGTCSTSRTASNPSGPCARARSASASCSRTRGTWSAAWTRAGGSRRSTAPARRSRGTPPPRSSA